MLPTGKEAVGVFPRHQTKTCAVNCQRFPSLIQGKHPKHFLLSGNPNVCMTLVIKSPQRLPKGWVLLTCQSPGHSSTYNLLCKKALDASLVRSVENSEPNIWGREYINAEYYRGAGRFQPQIINEYLISQQLFSNDSNMFQQNNFKLVSFRMREIKWNWKMKE